MGIQRIFRWAASASTLAVAILASPAAAQYDVSGPYGAAQNYGYYGGFGPYGFGAFGFGWAGYTDASPGIGPALPPYTAGPDLRYEVQTARLAPASASTDRLQQQASAASYREWQRRALANQARYDLETQRPRSARPLPSPAGPAPSLADRIATLFGPDGRIAWPPGLDDAPAARRQVESASRLALDEYRALGRADVEDVALARRALTTFGGPVAARLAAADDPLTYQSTLDFFQALDATLIDLADPPVEAPADPTPDASR